jgi:hypothetical protein
MSGAVKQFLGWAMVYGGWAWEGATKFGLWGENGGWSRKVEGRYSKVSAGLARRPEHEDPRKWNEFSRTAEIYGEELQLSCIRNFLKAYFGP